MADKYKGLKDFFKMNSDLKMSMSELAPTSSLSPELSSTNFRWLDSYNFASYSDKLWDFLNDAKFQFQKVERELYGQTSPTTESFFKNLQEKLAQCSTKQQLDEFYKNYISDMRPEFVDKVKGAFIGYSLGMDFTVFGKAHTLNEYLHAFHSSITNNEAMYEVAPINKEFTHTDARYPAQLFGDSTELAEKVFGGLAAITYIPNKYGKESGTTQIMSISDAECIVMIRDKGHALTLHIQDYGDGNIGIDYFIPKICNMEMINNLPGVRKVDEHSNFATGHIEATVDMIGLKAMELVYNIPTDFNMPLLAHLDPNIGVGTEPFLSTPEIVAELDPESLLVLANGNPIVFDDIRFKETFEKIGLDKESLSLIKENLESLLRPDMPVVEIEEKETKEPVIDD